MNTPLQVTLQEHIFFAMNIMITLLDHQSSVLINPRVYGFAVEDDLPVPVLGLHPKSRGVFSILHVREVLNSTMHKSKEWSTLLCVFAILKALQQMALAARTHLVASTELTSCDIV